MKKKAGKQGKKQIFFRKNAKNMHFCLDSWGGFMYTAVTATLLAVPEKEKAPVAQLDRASDYGSEGLRFESSRACSHREETKCRFDSTKPVFLSSHSV